MKSKINEKKLAIKLRKQGLSYSEILEKVAVSQASLSLWLKDIKLNSNQKNILLKKKKLGQIKGAKKRKAQKIEKIIKIKKEAIIEIGEFDRRDLFIAGICLYWGEGLKQTKKSPTQGLVFGNSDPDMIKLYLAWLKDCLNIKINSKNIVLTLYLHKNAPEKSIKIFWQKHLNVNNNYFRKTVYKDVVYNKKINNNYKGLIRVEVRKSTDLNRKTKAWVEAICKLHCRII